MGVGEGETSAPLRPLSSQSPAQAASFAAGSSSFPQPSTTPAPGGTDPPPRPGPCGRDALRGSCCARNIPAVRIAPIGAGENTTVRPAAKSLPSAPDVCGHPRRRFATPECGPGGRCRKGAWPVPPDRWRSNSVSLPFCRRCSRSPTSVAHGFPRQSGLQNAFGRSTGRALPAANLPRESRRDADPVSHDRRALVCGRPSPPSCEFSAGCGPPSSSGPMRFGRVVFRCARSSNPHSWGPEALARARPGNPRIL